MMNKIDKTVIEETKYILGLVLVFSVLLQAVFLIIGKWDYKVLLGNLLTDIFTVLNFFLMGLSVQKALSKDEKEARQVMKISQTYRSFMMIIGIIIGIVIPVFNTYAVIIPIVFPRIAIALRQVFNKK